MPGLAGFAGVLGSPLATTTDLLGDPIPLFSGAVGLAVPGLSVNLGMPGFFSTPSSYLLDEGFEEVYHLKGGILKYLEHVPKDAN